MAGDDETVRHLLSGAGEAIPLFKVFMPESVVEPLRRTLFSGFIGEGPRVEEFEGALAQFAGARHAVAVSSGTAALHAAVFGRRADAGAILTMRPPWASTRWRSTTTLRAGGARKGFGTYCR